MLIIDLQFIELVRKSVKNIPAARNYIFKVVIFVIYGGWEAGSRIQDTGYWMLDVGCWMPDAGYWMLDAGFARIVISFLNRNDSIINQMLPLSSIQHPASGIQDPEKKAIRYRTAFYHLQNLYVIL